MLKEGELLSVLGTLAYAPEGVKAVLDGDDLKDDRYSVDAHLLYRGTLTLSLHLICINNLYLNLICFLVRDQCSPLWVSDVAAGPVPRSSVRTVRPRERRRRR
jgi:hypothetical protein